MEGILILFVIICLVSWLCESLDPPSRAPRPGSDEEARLHAAAMKRLEIEIAKERGFRHPDDVI